MSVRVSIEPALIRWACDRSRRSDDDLAAKFPGLHLWLSGEKTPTIKQLESFAKATRTPLGYLFLAEPPVEALPIPDFRTVGSEAVQRPSPDLLDTIYLCEQRQEWYRHYAMMSGEPPLDFIGSATTKSDIVATAAEIRRAVGFDLAARAEARTFVEALRLMIDAADDAGVLVMVSGIVGSNSRRPLSTSEFRGFALSDIHAPLVFINGADTKSGQMFTLAHELAHLWLGASGVSDATAASSPPARADIERWCNAVAAEMLVPLEAFQEVYRPNEELSAELRRLSKHYKVSTLVILRRMLDAGGLSRKHFGEAFDAEVSRLREQLARQKARSKGGDSYANMTVRLSERFARAVLASTWEGRSTFTEAFRLLGCRKVSTLETLGDRLGMGSYLAGGAV
jgi:Zn-dependent peptidase ImmA (M78 family)